MSVKSFPNAEMEEQRLAALYSYDVLGAGLRDELDNLVRLAVQISNANTAYITFVDKETVVIKAIHGVTPQELVLDREKSVCQYDMYKGVYFVPDIRKDKRFLGSYVSNSTYDFAFYGSVPLIDDDGFPLGCLCIADNQEKILTPLQIEALQTLSLQIIAQLSLRRKNLELAAQTKRSEEFIDVFQASPEIHCMLSRDGDILFINQAAHSILGYAVEEVLGKSIWSFCYKDDIVGVTKDLEEGLRSGRKQFSLDFRIFDKSGNLKFLSWSMVAKNDKWYGYGRDVTEKKRLDIELTHLSFVASKVNNGVVISDDHNRVSWANDAFTHITGFTLEDVQGKPLGDLISGPDTDWSVIEEARKLISEKKSFTVDILAYRKDKKKIWLSIYSTIILSADGEVETEIEIILDITAKKQAEQELRVLSTVASKTDTGVAIYNQRGEITWVNEALENIVEFSSEELIGKMLGDLISTSETDKSVIWEARKASELKKSFAIEVLVRTKTGRTIWLEVSSTPVLNNEDKVERYVELITDVTERKKIEQDTLFAKEQALQLSEAKEMFLSVMSHEIRTPLNAVLGMTHLLLDSNPKPSQIDDLNILKFSSENLLNIVNDVLDFTKIETGKLDLEFTPVNLHNLCNDIINSLQINAQKQKNQLSLHFDTEIPDVVFADQTRLYQVLMNLLGNAIKFTHNGKVDLILEKRTGTADQVEIYFEVTDTGIGIPADKKEYIFETFTQARADISRKYGGTGLGLAITKKLLKLYDAEISVESTEGKGTSFSFIISFDTTSKKEQQEKVDALFFMGKRVLVVDDNEINILIAKRMLSKWGLEIDSAINGPKAIEAIIAKKYDLVLMDINMPGITGFETTVIIREMEEEYYKNLPIVALTASTLLADESKFAASGMNGHLLKPFKPSEIKKALIKYLR